MFIFALHPISRVVFRIVLVSLAVKGVQSILHSRAVEDDEERQQDNQRKAQRVVETLEDKIRSLEMRIAELEAMLPASEADQIEHERLRRQLADLLKVKSACGRDHDRTGSDKPEVKSDASEAGDDDLDG